MHRRPCPSQYLRRTAPPLQFPVLPTVFATFRDLDDLRTTVSQTAQRRGLYIPGNLNVTLGQRVVVELTTIAERLRFECCGTVRRRRVGAPGQCGIDIAVAPHSGGSPPAWQLDRLPPTVSITRPRRFAVELPVVWCEEQTEPDVLINISRAGALLLTPCELRLGAPLELRLLPAPCRPLTLQSVVARRVLHFDTNAYGLRFVNATMQACARFERLIGVIGRTASRRRRASAAG